MEPQTFWSKYKAIIIVALVVLLGFFFYQKVIAKTALMTVTGEGSVTAVPEMAKITATVSFSSSTGTEALTGAQQLIKAINASLQSQGIGKENVRAMPLTVSTLGTGANKVSRASGALEVTIPNVSEIDKVTWTLLSIGVNDITSTVLTTKDSQALEKKAIGLAIKNAQERAKEIAKASGKRLGRLVSMATSEVGDANALTTKGEVKGGDVIEIKRQASLVYEVR